MSTIDPGTTGPSPTDSSVTPVPPTATPTARRGPRAGTVVWGLLVIAVGVLIIVATTGVAVDLQLAAIIGLAAAGVLLLVTALISSARQRHR